MADGDLVQTATAYHSTGNASSHNSPVLGVAPTVGNTQFLAAMSDAAISTPSGWTLDSKEESWGGLYIFRRVVVGGDGTGAVALSLSASRPCSIYRWESVGIFAVHVQSTPKFDNVGLFPRTSNALVTTLTSAILCVSSNDSATDETWSAVTPVGLTQQQHGLPSGGTNRWASIWLYATPLTAGTRTVAATSTLSSRYQILAVAYTITGGSTPVSGSDTGSGVEAVTSIQLTAPGDTGAVVDAGVSIAAALSAAETATGAELPVRIALTAPGDTGAAVDAIGRIALAGDDPATVADNGALNVTTAASETGAAADLPGSIALTAPGDTGTSADAGTVGVSFTGTDTGSAVEAVASIALTAPGDAGTAADAVSALSAGVNAQDVGGAVEAPVSIKLTAPGDTGVAIDAATVGVGFTAGDTGAATDLGSVLANLGGPDTGTVSDNGQIQANPQTSDAGTAQDNGSIVVFITASDSGTAVDDAVRIALNALDQAAAVDAVLAFGLALNGNDTGTGTDDGTVEVIGGFTPCVYVPSPKPRLPVDTDLTCSYEPSAKPAVPSAHA